MLKPATFETASRHNPFLQQTFDSCCHCPSFRRPSWPNKVPCPPTTTFYRCQLPARYGAATMTECPTALQYRHAMPMPSEKDWLVTSAQPTPRRDDLVESSSCRIQSTRVTIPSYCCRQYYNYFDCSGHPTSATCNQDDPSRQYRPNAVMYPCTKPHANHSMSICNRDVQYSRA